MLLTAKTLKSAKSFSLEIFRLYGIVNILSTQKHLSCEKGCGLGKKSCKMKSGGQEMAAMISMQKQPSCIKRMWPLKAWVKSCEIKGGGHEMAEMMLTLIHLIAINYH